MTLARLLEVQAHDTTIDQLAHRRDTLPERDALAQIDDERQFLEDQRATLAAERHEHERAQKRIEDEVAMLEERYGSETSRLYSGTVTAHKDLEAIQHELESLERRQRTLEDQILEIMETVEPISSRIADIDAGLASVAERHEAVSASVAETEAEIATAIASERSQRQEVASAIDPDLLREYEGARTQCGGIGVSRLIDKTCEGCRLELSAVKYDRIRKQPPDTLAWCDCGRILVA